MRGAITADAAAQLKSRLRGGQEGELCGVCHAPCHGQHATPSPRTSARGTAYAHRTCACIGAVRGLAARRGGAINRHTRNTAVAGRAAAPRAAPMRAYLEAARVDALAPGAGWHGRDGVGRWHVGAVRTLCLALRAARHFLAEVTLRDVRRDPSHRTEKMETFSALPTPGVLVRQDRLSVAIYEIPPRPPSPVQSISQRSSGHRAAGGIASPPLHTSPRGPRPLVCDQAASACQVHAQPPRQVMRRGRRVWHVRWAGRGEHARAEEQAAGRAVQYRSPEPCCWPVASQDRQLARSARRSV